MQMTGFVFVGLGGAVGAMLRYAVSLLPYRGTRRQAPEGLILFLKTGVCGGFTTFSTFSLEAWQLLEKGETGLSALYVLLSVLFCLAGVAAGMWAASRW